MPAKGSPIIKTRIPADLLEEVNAQIAQRNYHTSEEEWTVSGFIIKAIREKLAHMRRARRSHQKPNAVFYHDATNGIPPKRKGKGKGTKGTNQEDLFHE